MLKKLKIIIKRFFSKNDIELVSSEDTDIAGCWELEDIKEFWHPFDKNYKKIKKLNNIYSKTKKFRIRKKVLKRIYKIEGKKIE